MQTPPSTGAASCLGNSLHFALLLAAAARIGVMHARKKPFARSWNVDQNAVAQPGVWQPIRLIQPAADSTGIAVNFGGERLEIEIVGEEIRFRHFWHSLSQRVTVPDKLATSVQKSLDKFAGQMSKKLFSRSHQLFA